MEAKGWKGGLLGVRVGVENRQQYFNKDWTSVQIELDGQIGSFRLTSGFWRHCPEIRGKEIQEWMLKRGLAPWPHGKPPQLELTPLGGSRFRLTTDQR
jgi:hypothetical protein